jgi:methionine synthase II (cobalamin-independent)
MSFYSTFPSTVVGSFPHTKAKPLCETLVSVPCIPAWPQLPRRSFLENMYVQFSAPLPCIQLDHDGEKILFDTSGDLSEALIPFYERYLADDIDAFALAPKYAVGFDAMLEVLHDRPGEWVKGQITGPISFGLTVTDQNLRASLYHEALRDVIVKNLAMNARWQVRELLKVRPNVILSVDEPYLASFGSAFVSLEREDVIRMLDEIFSAIHQEGALAAIHCCANTDWSLLLATSVDILNPDAYGYMQQLTLYPEEIDAFLKRGGIFAWGIVPNNEEIEQATPENLVSKLHQGMETILEKAHARGLGHMEELTTKGLITPSCGLGSATIEVSDRAIEMLPLVSQAMRQI